MKRHLKHDRYRMEDRQAESLWYRIRGELRQQPPAAGPRRGAWRPALATVAALAIVGVAATWWLGDARSNRAGRDLASRNPAGGGTDVAALEQTPETGGGVASRSPAVGAPSARAKSAERDDADRTPATPPSAAATGSTAPPSSVVADRRGVITGRVVDRTDGSAVAYANVMLVGTTRGSATDSTGAFRFEAVEPGRRYDIQVVMLGYAPFDVAVEVPSAGTAVVACALEPVVVATLQNFDVTGEEYMVEIRSAVTESPRPAGTVRYANPGQARQELSKQAGAGPGNGNSAPAAPAREAAQALSGAHGNTWGGSITGGTTPPNGETVELMYFKHAGVNPFVATDEDALSTFALDVDTASFSVARNYLERGVLPPADAIRVEEFVNALTAGWPSQTKDTFRIGLDGGRSQFGEGYHLLRVGVVGRTLATDRRKPANLVFVIDVSGSMNRESRLGAVKRALRTLVDELGEGDRVGIVVYGSQGEIRLPLTDAGRRETILDAIDQLQPAGSTNAAEGLRLGYQLARDGFDAGIINRLILCSDGVANSGDATDAEGILALARRGSDDGITLSTVGFGMGNYNDVLMEQLADQGDGNYFYVDRPAEAERVFRENLTGMLQTIARQAKVQVEFDSRRVSRWRLLGYENRDVADRDFRNDAVDAGEVGAGHQVTALYEIKLVGGARDADEDDRVAVVRLRWEAPEHETDGAGRVTEIERAVTRGMFDVSDRSGSPHRRAQVLAAEFAEILRGSYWARDSRLSALVAPAAALAAQLPDEPAVQDLARMIRQAADLQNGTVRPAVQEDGD